tara:strand:- start:5062 stop:5673 length:612 start_codon:yes stop_codon:yes gene_type:complete
MKNNTKNDLSFISKTLNQIKNQIKVIIFVILLVIIFVIFLFIPGKNYTSSTKVVDNSNLSGKNNNQSENLAPNFTLLDTEGNNVSLSDYKGKVVIINFWTTWCGPCRYEIPDLVQLYDKYNQDLIVLGISLDYDGPAVVPQFEERIGGVNYPLLYGNNNISNLYGGVTGVPTTFIIDRNMQVFKKYLGYRSPELIEKDINELI